MTFENNCKFINEKIQYSKDLFDIIFFVRTVKGTSALMLKIYTASMIFIFYITESALLTNIYNAVNKNYKRFKN